MNEFLNREISTDGIMPFPPKESVDFSFFLLIKILKFQLFFIYLQKKKITYKNFHIDTNQDVTFNEGGNLFI